MRMVRIIGRAQNITAPSGSATAPTHDATALDGSATARAQNAMALFESATAPARSVMALFGIVMARWGTLAGLLGMRVVGVVARVAVRWIRPVELDRGVGT